MSDWTPQRALGQMDQHGVDAAVVSITDPGVWVGDVQTTRRVARSCNEYAAQLVRDHPARFGFFATLPLPDIDGSLNELAYAFDVLKTDGIGLMTNYSNIGLGDATFTPILEELNRRRAVVHVHPTTATCCQNVVAGVPDVVLEFPHDTTRAVTSLLYSRALARFRSIRFILSHAGGTVPMLAGRIQAGAAFFGLETIAPDGVEHELGRLYYDRQFGESAGVRRLDRARRQLADPVRDRLPVCGCRSGSPQLLEVGIACGGVTGDPPRQRGCPASTPSATRLGVTSIGPMGRRRADSRARQTDGLYDVFRRRQDDEGILSVLSSGSEHVEIMADDHLATIQLTDLVQQRLLGIWSAHSAGFAR